ncbi:MAG: DUF4209 domain-containing protein [Deltaproteobacteria bacterium]|nr:DUF4209 domain-containing protein [Deltaproteobacteria bacterium]
MDEQPQDCLPLTGHPIAECDLDAPIREISGHDFTHAQSAYSAAAKQAEESGEDSEGRAYRSLAIICSFYPRFDNRGEPYGPMMQWEGKRTAIPDDLTDADLDTVTTLRTKIVSPLIRARLGDVLWLRRRDHIATKDACSDYITAGETGLTKEDWVDSIELLYRALQLAHFLGRDKEGWKQAEAATVRALQSPFAETEPFFAAKILRILLQMGAGEPAQLAELAGEHAKKAATEVVPDRARTYYDQEADFWAVAKEPEKEAEARLASAMTYEEEAERSLKRSAPSLLVASHFLAQGVEALRRAHADPATVARVRKKLREYQRDSIKEMKPVLLSPDVAAKADELLEKAAKQAIEAVKDSDFKEALRRLAFAHPTISASKLREEVLKLAKDHPLSHLFEASFLDQAGRVRERVGGLLEAGPTQEDNIEARMFQHAAQFIWTFRASSYIEPARRQIWLQHLPRQDDFGFLVFNNPFVPPGHEGMFLRGLYYGLAGDMLLAVHLLTPQIENSIRYVLEQNDVDVSNLDSNLTQPVKTLGPLLLMPETKKIFGEDWCFELRGLLIEKTGYSYRHQVAHGFASEGACYGPEALNVWWIVLRLCYTPIILDEKQAGDTQS